MTRVVPDPTERLIKLRAMIFVNKNKAALRVDGWRCCHSNTWDIAPAQWATVAFANMREGYASFY